jgi:pyrimidine operon attenuation protein/uracil phosphoribosyltransferase
LDETALDRALTRIAHEILEKNGGAKDLAFVGLRTRGVSLAHRLAAKIARSMAPPFRSAPSTSRSTATISACAAHR